MNQVYTHPGQEQMQVEVILASKHPEIDNPFAHKKHEMINPLVTMRLRYPRIIHGEVMTHRVFSRNARSSRAVPVKTMLLECTSIPFVPWHWGKNQKGMQADAECDELLFINSSVDHWENRQDAWLIARDAAVEVAEAYMNAGYHKQIPNRLLEPFSWIDVLITSNDWDNFLWLRDHKDAEPHLQDLARLVKQALDEMDVQDLQPGEWHLPYITHDDWVAVDPMEDYNLTLLSKISAARCARISYKPFDGDASYERELERYDHLVTSERVHASPLEHQATPDELVYGDMSTTPDEWAQPHLHGNLTGWIQARKLVPNEYYST